MNQIARKYQVCSGCSDAQELPAIFCTKCGTPLLKISKLFLTVFLTFTVSVFVIFGLYQGKLLWPLPLYAYYAILFVLYSMTVTRGYRVITFRMFAWCSILAYAMWFFYLSPKRGLEFLTSDIRDIFDLIDNEPIAMWIFIALIVLEVALAFALPVRRFGLVLGYRVYFSFLALAAFIGQYAFTYASGGTGVHVSRRLTDWFTWAPDKEVKELFELIGVNLLRAVVAEMAVYSFIKAYKPAMEHYNRIAAMDHQRRTDAGATAALTDATARLTGVVLRSALLIQHFFVTFFHTARTYLWAVWRTTRRIFADLLIPAAALVAAATILAILTEHSANYITGKGGGRLVYLPGITSSWQMIFICLLMIFVVQYSFLAAITKFSFRALWRCNTLLLLWIAPFAFALFLFVSVSLVATGSVLRRWDNETFPYHFGPMTAMAAVVVAAMVGYALFHTQRARAAAPISGPADTEPAAGGTDRNVNIGAHDVPEIREPGERADSV